MGFGGISIWQMLIVLVIVVLIFGTKKLRNAGGDLGSAVSNFKKQMKNGEEGTESPEQLEQKEPDSEFSKTTADSESSNTKGS